MRPDLRRVFEARRRSLHQRGRGDEHRPVEISNNAGVQVVRTVLSAAARHSYYVEGQGQLNLAPSAATTDDGIPLTTDRYWVPVGLFEEIAMGNVRWRRTT